MGLVRHKFCAMQAVALSRLSTPDFPCWVDRTAANIHLGATSPLPLPFHIANQDSPLCGRSQTSHRQHFQLIPMSVSDTLFLLWCGGNRWCVWQGLGTCVFTIPWMTQESHLVTLGTVIPKGGVYHQLQRNSRAFRNLQKCVATPALQKSKLQDLFSGNRFESSTCLTPEGHD